MEEHEKALGLLTHRLKDYRGAEKYCTTHSQVLCAHTCMLCFLKTIIIYIVSVLSGWGYMTRLTSNLHVAFFAFCEQKKLGQLDTRLWQGYVAKLQLRQKIV